MKLGNVFTKERVVSALKSVGKLRLKISHNSVITFSALLLILFIAFTVRIFPMRWEIQTGTMHLSEFDPYYQYSLAKYEVEHGLLSPYWPNQWIDKQRWYPDGQNMAISYPALPMTAALFYDIVSFLGVNIDLMSFCALFPVIMGTLTCLIIYFLGKDIGGRSVGLFASLFLALSASYIQRTSLGFFDDETIGILTLILFSLLFLRAIEEDRPVGSAVKYAIGSAAALAYFVLGWGAAYYPIGLAVLFVFVLLLLRRYRRRILLSYSITFGLGLLIAINAPYISTKYLTTAAVLPVAGLFALLCLFEILPYLVSLRAKATFTALLLGGLAGSFVLLWRMGLIESVAGKFLSVIDPLVRAASPLIESVAEHRISSWGSMYYDFGVMILFFAVSFYFILRNPTDKNLFLMLFGLTSLYFGSSMVRLLLLLAPAFSILAAVGTIGVLKPFITLLKEPSKIVSKKKFGLEHVGKEFSGTAVFMVFLILMTNFAISPQSGGIPKVLSQAYAPITITAGSLPISPQEPVREWMDMLVWTRGNLNSGTVVCAWWDYGYWLTLLGNVTSLADNATINYTQIENVGLIFMANETRSLKMLKRYDAKYILVFTTVRLSQSTTGSGYDVVEAGYGDEGKWMWMARISGQAHDRFVSSVFIDEGSSWTDETKFGSFNQSKWTWNDVGGNSTIYKLMSWARHEWASNWASQYGLREPEVYVEPQYFKEAYIAGLNLSPQDAQKYGGIIPLVCLYEIEYPTG
jgi:dolichyl-diphosphooligosaccharide--protein glycosyltransferase